ncbi:hypothetical protein ASG82_22650 [Mycobacterium sp. Soil538]|nr:hypothetical protein ASG82_22650 [Mycobacterium sp. Soil538]
MRSLSLLVTPVLVASAVTVLPVAAAPVAVAGCVKTSGISVCDDGGAAGTGPFVPYPCEQDWYCYDGSSWDLGLAIDPPPPTPGPPDIGRPGRPDIGQPGRPGGGGGGGGGGGRR